MDFGELRVTYVGDPRPAVRAATEVDRVHRQTTRSAEQNDRLVERSARQLAQVRSREAKRAADDFIRELERMRRAERASGGGGFGGELSTLAGGRLAFAGGGAVAGVGALTAGFLAAAKAGVEYKGTIDKLTRSFESLLGSSQAANQHLAELREFANRTPFEFEDVARASQRFQAMGIEAQKVVPLLQDMGNAVASIGGGKDELDRVALAIAQINAKGRVMSQEMNQLSEVGISGWKALQAETGKTREELMRMVEAGEVSAETFNRAFHRMYGSSNAMQKQMETLSGASSTLKDATKLLLADAFTPLHNILRDTAVELAKISTEGFNAQRGLMAAASVFRSGFNMANLGGGDNLLMALAYQQGGPKLAMAVQALLRGAQPTGAGDTGAKPGDWFNKPVRVPEQYQYKQKVSDASIFAAQQARAEAAAEAAMRKANQEAERQSEIIKRISQDFAEASTRVTGFSRDALQLEAGLYKLSIGFDTLSEANKKLAQAEINKLFSARRELENLREREEFQKTLKEGIEQATVALYGEKTATEQLNDVMAVYVANFEKANSALPRFDDQMRQLIVTAKDAAHVLDLMGLVDSMQRLSGMLRDIPLTPGKAVGTAKATGYAAPLDLSKVKEDPWATMREDWRQNLEHMKVDGVDYFADMFMRIGEGWRSMVGGLALDFARSLQQMAAQAAASAVWGAVLKIAGSALAGAFGPKIPTASAAGGPGGINWLLPGKADGGPARGWTVVGERGPELVNFTSPAHVFSNQDSKKMLGGQTIINKTTVINYQPRVTPSSYASRRSSRETFETLLAFVR